MKRISVFISMVLFAVFTAGVNAQIIKEGDTHSELGQYRISVGDAPIEMDGKELKTYKIEYEHSDVPVYIGMKGRVFSRDFIVVSGDLTIQYTKMPFRFGVDPLSEKYGRKFSMNKENIDRREYYHQRVLSSDLRGDRHHASLIAVFYPRLVKDKTKAFAIK